MTTEAMNHPDTEAYLNERPNLRIFAQQNPWAHVHIYEHIADDVNHSPSTCVACKFDDPEPVTTHRGTSPYSEASTWPLTKMTQIHG